MRRMVLVLTAVTLISGALLAAAYEFFLPEINENSRRALSASLASLFGGEGLQFELMETRSVPAYRVRSAGGEIVGYVAEIRATGYGGPIRLLVGVPPDLGSITRIEVVENIETPGLGGRIDDEWFKEQFAGLDPSEAVGYVKNAAPSVQDNRIQAISGATISTGAVVDAINRNLSNAVAEIREIGTSGEE